MEKTEAEIKDGVRQNELKKLEHLQQQAKPLWLTKQFVERPCIVILVSLVFMVICTILTITQSLLAQSESTNREWLVWDDPKVIDNDIWTEAQDTFQRKSVVSQINERSQEVEEWNTILMLECRSCSNVLNVKDINLLIQTEDRILEDPEYQKFCLSSTSSLECSEDAFNSFTKFFTSEQRKNGITQADLDAVLDTVLIEANWENNAHFFHNKFTKDNKEAKVMMSIFKYGGPLTGYENKFDKDEKQNDKFVDYSKDLNKLIKSQDKKARGGVNLIPISSAIAEIEFQKVINGDFLWALASIAFVWAYMTFHLKSFFLSSFAMFNIVMSFPLTLVIFKLIFQIEYFSTLHILVVFIVLGIAADDVFVFVDAWEQTRHYAILDDLNKRMAVTFKRAAKAMLATSSTTAAAFLATGFSSIMPISSFGYFAFILIPMNYLLVITFFPALLILQQKHLKNLCSKKKDNKNEVQQQEYEQNNQQLQQQQQQEAKQVEINTSQNQMQNPSQNNNDQNAVPNNFSVVHHKEENAIEKFFGTKFNTFIFKAKYIIVAVLLIWFIVATVLALQMGPQTKPEQWLPDDYDLQRAINYSERYFHQSAESVNVLEVFIYWGVTGLSKDGVGMWDPEDVGKLKWDKNFNLAPKANQQFVYDFCLQLRQQEFVLDNQVDCFIEDFKNYVEGKLMTFPVQENQFFDELNSFVATPEGKDILQNDYIGLFEGKLNYIGFRSVSVKNPDLSYKYLEPEEKKWQKFVTDQRKIAPEGVNKMKQASGDWAWMKSEKEFVRNAVQGMVIALAFALVVLVISTHNIIISLYSVLSITGIVVSVVAVMQLSGWQMGVAESITVVILIGFSVDYVVHLANHYVESSYDDRYTRMQESLKEIGISIVSGAITTLGSGIFLFFAVVSIFTKFAVLIVATICFSLIFSLFFFAALMHAAGPNKDFGNIVILFQKKCLKRADKVHSEKGNLEVKPEVTAAAPAEDKV